MNQAFHQWRKSVLEAKDKRGLPLLRNGWAFLWEGPLEHMLMLLRRVVGKITVSPGQTVTIIDCHEPRKGTGCGRSHEDEVKVGIPAPAVPVRVLQKLVKYELTRPQMII